MIIVSLLGVITLCLFIYTVRCKERTRKESNIILFEQSGTFKNEFKKLGFEAFDYDIQNNFGETDYVIDLFAEIDNAYLGG